MEIPWFQSSDPATALKVSPVPVSSMKVTWARKRDEDISQWRVPDRKRRGWDQGSISEVSLSSFEGEIDLQ